MIKLLAIYLSALFLVALAPARIASFQFLNISKAIQFEIDPTSPATSVEKDFMAIQKNPKESKNFASLNEYVGKPYVPRRNFAQTSRPVLDYSQLVRTDSWAYLMLTGPVELKQGLALTDVHRIEIHRENRGQIFEFGEVDIQKGTYQIQLASLEGHICGKLRGNRDEVVGQGCFALERVKAGSNGPLRGPLLSVEKTQDLLAQKSAPASLEIPVAMADKKPSSSETKGSQLFREPIPRREVRNRIIGFYDYDNPQAKPLNAQVESTTGALEDGASTTIVTISAPQYPLTRTVANAYTPSRGAVIPPKQALNALRQLADETGATVPGQRIAGTIWGRTMNEGRSVAGRSVELEGSDAKPVYLNEFYIPDPNQKTTASHGLYAFVGVPEGEYSIRATAGNQFAGFQNVSVRENALALGDIDSTERRRPTRLALYDLVNKTSQSAVVTLQNYEEDLIVEDGQADVNVIDNYDTAFALVNPLNKKYLTAQYILNPGEDLYNMPLVSSGWVEQVLSSAKLQRPVRSKIVLGIGSQKPYRVEAVGSKEAQIIYFDSEGQIVEGEYGVAGGGFFVIDPEDGINEYAIQTVGEKSLRVIYMPTLPNVLNVIQL